MLGKSLQHYGIKRNVLFTNRASIGSTIKSVNFEVTDTKRAILSVHEGFGNGSMIVFTPDGRGKIVNDKKCIEQVQQIMGTTPGFDIVFDRGAYVLWASIMESTSTMKGEISKITGISFLVIRKEYWERALSQAQEDHERKQSSQQEVHGENQNTFEHVKFKAQPKPRAHERGTSVP